MIWQIYFDKCGLSKADIAFQQMHLVDKIFQRKFGRVKGAPRLFYPYNNCDITFLTKFMFILTHPPSLWEETGVPGENPRLPAGRWHTLFT